MRIRQAAVLGAGVMGAQIAAHLANAQIPSLLLDVVLPGGALRDQAARNGLETALKSRPATFFVPESAGLVTTGNFDDDPVTRYTLSSNTSAGSRRARACE